MDYKWLENVFASHDDNLIVNPGKYAAVATGAQEVKEAATGARDSSSMNNQNAAGAARGLQGGGGNGGSPEPDFIIDLLKMLPNEAEAPAEEESADANDAHYAPGAFGTEGNTLFSLPSLVIMDQPSQPQLQLQPQPVQIVGSPCAAAPAASPLSADGNGMTAFHQPPPQALAAEVVGSPTHLGLAGVGLRPVGGPSSPMCANTAAASLQQQQQRAMRGPVVAPPQAQVPMQTQRPLQLPAATTSNAAESSQSAERDVGVPREWVAAVEAMYTSFHASWMAALNALHDRFKSECGDYERVLVEMHQLRQENQHLRRENIELRNALAVAPQQGQGMAGARNNNGTGGGNGNVNGLLVNAMSLEEEEEKVFEPQIDKTKLKTKLCKYFMQAKGEEGCPFHRRHGWCAFAHGESELHTVYSPANHSGGHPFNNASSPLMQQSPIQRFDSTDVTSPLMFHTSPRMAVGRSTVSPLSIN